MRASQLGQLIECLPSIHNLHMTTSKIYSFLNILAKESISDSNLNDPKEGKIDLITFGEIEFPYYKMGAIDSLDLFGLDELIIFSFYLTNSNRYHRVADLGANLGLHSILMGRCGWEVNAYEPDPVHLALLKRNLELNKIKTVTVNEMAVSDKEGNLEFVRVLGNTTGSHLAGAKLNPYGELEKFSVKVASIENIMHSSDFIKMDVEGQEKQIITSTIREQWMSTDMMLEVGTAENAAIIFEHLKKIGVNSFSQKNGWDMVKKVDDVPTSHREGSLFISMKTSMPWGE